MPATLTQTETLDQLMFDGVKVALVQNPLPPPAENEVRIRTEFSHVSIGTEIAYIDKFTPTKQSTGLGYSNVGVIEELGAKATGFKVGQRVFTGLPHASHGNVNVQRGIVPVPDGLSSDFATLAGLSAVAYHVVERAAPRMLEPTIVMGQGVVGSLIAQVARLCGAEPVIVVDTDLVRLETARKIGFQTVDASREDAIARVKELNGGKGVPLCIEAATSARAISDAMKMLCLRGRLVLSSTIFDPVPFHILEDFIERELTVIGAHQPKCPMESNPYYLWTQVDNRRGALHAMLDGRLKVEHLISHRVKPHEATAIYERLRQKDRSIVGIVIDWTQR
jgi:2-desacetyl-2-hydroxyethyl bacteriochlorophyllide A dehydrogenase